MGKITLRAALDQGETDLIFYCLNHAVQYGGCFHSSEMSIAEAVAHWGLERRLDDLPVICSKCGSRNVDVRADHPRGIGGMPLGDKGVGGNPWKRARRESGASS